MIVPNFRPPYLTPIKIKGSSVNPNVLNWTDIRFTASAGEHQFTEQQVTGIGTPITISVNGSWGTASKLYYRVSSTPNPLPNPMINKDIIPTAATAFDYDLAFGQSSQGFTACLPFNDTTGSFTVNPNEYVAFLCWGQDQIGPAGFPTWTVTVNNESTSPPSELDTFDAITNA